MKNYNSRGQPQLERRSMTIRELRIADDGEGTEKYIEGYASVFDSWSEELGAGIAPFREKVCRGAFLETIEKDEIKALWNHNSDLVLGSKNAGTLELKEDERGLYVKIKPPKWAKDKIETIKRGDVNCMSFGFCVVLDKWYSDGDCEVRELLKVKLFDVSPVAYPAYPATECDVRSVYQTHEKRKKAAAAEKAAKRRGLEKAFDI